MREVFRGIASFPEQASRDRYNAAPFQHIPVVRDRGTGPECAMLRWGLVPSWSEDERIGSKTINARSETAADKPAFRDAFARRRCVIPADGFYEWKPPVIPRGRKQPIAVRCVNEHGEHPAMLMAGLWESWAPPDADHNLETFTILTCAANGFIEDIHPRMPVILSAEAARAWIDPAPVVSIDDAARMKRLLAARPRERMVFHDVSSRVNDVRNDERSLCEPVEAEPDSLFG